MSVDWTTVLVAIGPATVTGLVGWFGAKKNGEIALSQAEKNAEVAIAQAKVPIDQIGLSEAISDRRGRENAYHDLLDWLRTFDVAEGRVAVTTPEITEWRVKFDHAVNAVVLLGAEGVPEAADKCAIIVHNIMTNSAGVDRAFAADHDAFAEALADLLSAMRDDVSPRRG